MIRCPDSLDLKEMQKQISVPIINAGWGMKGHPTQALLDAVTLFERWGNLNSKKVLFVGDIKHSRVVGSHRELSSMLNYKIGYCAPPALLPQDRDTKNVEVFAHLDEGLKWADAVVGLRVQKERHVSQG